MTTEKNANGFKTRLAALERSKRKVTKEIEKLQLELDGVLGGWVKKFHRVGKVSLGLHKVKRIGTKKWKTTLGIIDKFYLPGGSATDTKKRDSLRAQIRAKEAELTSIAVQIGMTQEQERSETMANDELVKEVFALNDAMVQAAKERNDCLKRHVYPRLFYGEGKMHFRYTFTSKDGLRRVIARVNSKSKLKPDLATEAKALIDKVFAEYKQIAEMDKKLQPLYELTRSLLVETTDFKIGPEFHTFLGTKLDPDICPELVEAQRLLTEALTYEKTSSYVLLFERTSRTDPFMPVPQS